MTDLLSRIRPEKPWRVYAGRVSTDYIDEESSYRRVSELSQYAVYRWHYGAWVLVERNGSQR